jgi:hypothetical protein
MASKFHERFQLGISTSVARERFVNRAQNEILDDLAYRNVHHSQRVALARAVATHLGDRFEGREYLPQMVGTMFDRNLEALEGLYAAFGELKFVEHQKRLSGLVQQLLKSAETDLGIKWDKGLFYPSGADLLDQRLVNDSLHWLRNKKYENVLQPFEKGLRHLLEARKRPELTEDVVTDVYEALEALAGIVTGRPIKDLSANQEMFVAELKASEGYKRLLREYISYANTFRHAKAQNKARPKISLEEAESFVYLTGIFVRYATVLNG